MTKQLALGSILGAIILFLWSAMAWMAIPWPGEPLRTFTNEDAVIEAIKANAPRSGNYLTPNEPKRTPGMTDAQYNEAMQAAENKMMRGPSLFAAVRLEPFAFTAKPLVIQFLTQLLLAVIATFLLLQTTGLSYTKRVAFITAIGIVIFVGGHVEEWNWFGFSNAYLLMEFGAIVIGWLLASLAVAAFAKGKSATAAA